MIAQETASQISEKLLQRGRGTGQSMWDSGEGRIPVIKHIFFCRRLLLVMRSKYHHEEF